MAAETERISLAVHVLNAALRNPFLLAGQLAVAQAASGGRLEVGLGTGSAWARNDHQVASIPFPAFPERVARLEALCQVLPALWRGEEVTEEALGLRGASLGPLGMEVPPLIVGGQSDRVLEVAARHAQTWNGPGHDPEAFAEAAGRLDAACERVGCPSPVVREAQVFADRFVSGDGFRGLGEHLAQLEGAGAERVVVVLHEVRGPDAARRLAETVLS